MEPGGFLQSSLPSPPRSIGRPAEATHLVLPEPRATPLRPDGPKQSALIDYLDNKLLHISRRYQKRHNQHISNGQREVEDVQGYATIGEMARDLETLTDLVWISSTPSLQIPYLLTIAFTFSSSLSSYPFSPKSTFRLLKKLDTAFASLLRGSSIETGRPLPSFDNGRGKPSMTEKVRLRGIVESSRVQIVEVAGKSGSVAASGSVDYDTTTEDNDDTVNELDMDDGDERWEMEIARVYEHTIPELNMSLQN